MLLGKRFEAFVEDSPVSVMVRGTLERVFNPEKLDQVFEDHAVSRRVLASRRAGSGRTTANSSRIRRGRCRWPSETEIVYTSEVAFTPVYSAL